nr:MAG TPA: hypothetical protein [Caudoviricetes sp.]
MVVLRLIKHAFVFCYNTTSIFPQLAIKQFVSLIFIDGVYWI